MGPIYSPKKPLRDNRTQIDPEANKGTGLNAIPDKKHAKLFKAIDQLPTPEYRQKWMQVFNKEFLMEHPKKYLGPIIDMVQKRDWLSLKKANPMFYKIRRDLSVTTSSGLLFDNKLVIPAKLLQLVLQTFHSKYPGQVEMLALARFVWNPHKHSEIAAQTQSCEHSIEKGKNFKPMLPEKIRNITHTHWTQRRNPIGLQRTNSFQKQHFK